MYFKNVVLFVAYGGIILMQETYVEVHYHSCAEALLLYSWSDDAYFGKMWNLQAMIIHGYPWIIMDLHPSSALVQIFEVQEGVQVMEIAGSEVDSFVEFG